MSPRFEHAVVIGANGQLGTDLVPVLQARFPQVMALTHADVEICDQESIARALSGRAVDLVISTAAFHKVDACEAEATHAFEVNAFGARNLALACRDSGAALAYLSTDYVFGAERGRRIPYVEGDTVGPVNAYGISKIAGEFFVRATLERSFIIRTAGLFGAAGSSGKGGNFVELMLRLATEGRDIRVVDDQRTTPTSTRDLAEQVAVLVERAPFGTYHATAEGDCTWREFALEILRQARRDANAMPAKTGDFGEPARRPAYSVLENRALKELGLNLMRPWQEGLADYLTRRRLGAQVEVRA